MSMFQVKGATLLSLAVAMSAGSVVAQAQDATSQSHPRLSPARDVTVVYAVQPEKMPKPVQAIVQFKAEGDKLRIDSPDHAGSTILDRPAQRVTLIMHKQRVYTSFSPKHGLRNPFMLDMAMQYAPDGTGSVAGLACNKWTITSSHGKATACVTEDGVILSEEGVDADGLHGKLEAQTVTYGPVAEAQFQAPADYQQITAQMPIPHGGGVHGGGAMSSAAPK
ncbi:DUF4412 domain-containing protein [Asaia krungthepensis]|uniref:DUF4412 domain-containing protein n=1 Tax=Asaia krungthepensis NRIC 0535 TaxID=1307925 RepID=A0ABQ0Q655_9PROT|nr:DUF4412 domain-containing protein [Asaia krungthepensis]GBQ93210.1 hypothetical protein AA0535_2771 [Asaia krungthepensis NRIC 0535]